MCMSKVLYYNRGWLNADILQAVKKSEAEPRSN